MKPDTYSQDDYECGRPPPSWKCTRQSGHDGPCAAVPAPTPETHNFVHNVLGYIETRNHMKQMQDFAEKLEQERDIARAAIADLNQRLIDRTTATQAIIQQQALDIAHWQNAHRQAQQQLLAASAQIERMTKHHQESMETDSIVASCGCLTKTNDPQHHKPGCKYRLISERDEARAAHRDYAVLALYEHAHISEQTACKLTRLDTVSFRLFRENAFQSMCRLLDLPETPAPLPQP